MFSDNTADGGTSPANVDTWAFVTMSTLGSGIDPVVKMSQRKQAIREELKALGLTDHEIADRTFVPAPAYRFGDR